jgi:putative ABC transport system ATP-binding protein
MPRVPLIDLIRVSKVYLAGQNAFPALREVSLTIYRNEFVAIVGPSGSGKSTILNLITGIDRPTTGLVTVDGWKISRMGENQLAKWRGRNVGIVFQFFQLLPALTALENVMLPMEFRGTFRGRRRQRALETLRLVELELQANRLPSELSGGEQQRVAIARALANDPPLLIADEPTGNLDSASGERIVDILARLHRREDKTVILVTHDHRLAERAGRIIEVRDGQIAGDKSSPK